MIKTLHFNCKTVPFKTSIRQQPLVFLFTRELSLASMIIVIFEFIAVSYFYRNHKNSIMQNESFDPLGMLKKETPEVAEAFEKLIQSIIMSDGLNEKTKQLIYIALKATQGDIQAVSFHVMMAKNAGASKSEVIDALLVTLTVAGIRGITTGLPAVASAF